MGYDNHKLHTGLYMGSVIHERFSPKQHKLKYNLFSMFIDLDDLDFLDRNLWLFSVNKFNLVSFNYKDYGNGSKNLKNYVLEKIRNSNCKTKSSKVYLLTMPRIFGYVFNPLSVYFCYDQDNVLCALLYEVSNTFGEKHDYVFHVDDPDKGYYLHTCAKSFYVSPFLEMDLVYKFKIRPPTQLYSLLIDVFKEEKIVLRASQKQKFIELTEATLLKAILTYPFMTLKVILGIHFEALILLLKGVVFIPRTSQAEERNKAINNSTLIGK